MSPASGSEPPRRDGVVRSSTSRVLVPERDARDPALERIVRLAAVVARARAAALSFVDDDGPFTLASSGTPPVPEALAHALMERVVRAESQGIATAHAADDPETGPVATQHEVRAYAAVAVTDAGGRRVGALSVVDPEAIRDAGPAVLDALADLAALTVDTLEAGTRRRALAAAEAEIQRIAVVDPLTGLANRRGFDERLDGAVALGRRASLTAAVLMIGVDGLERLHELRGQGAFDEVVLELAERLSLAVREHDLVARAGPEAFVVLLQAIDRAAVAEAAGRLHEALARVLHGVAAGEDAPGTGGTADGGTPDGGTPDGSTPAGERESLRLRVSIGVALHPGDGEDVASLLRAADLARHEARSAGGGVRRFAPPSSTRT